MKYEIGAKIKRLRESQGLNQKEFASLVGVSNSRVSNWELGINRPDVDTLADICAVLSVSADALLETRPSATAPWSAPLVTAYEAAIEPTQQAACAVLGIPHLLPDLPPAPTPIITYSFRAAAGIPVWVDGDCEERDYPSAVVPRGTSFAIGIDGDSMEPTIPRDSVVFVKRQPDLNNGEIGVFMINGDEAVCKRYYKDKDGVRLLSDNPEYAPIHIAKDAEGFGLVGKVVGHWVKE